MITQCSGGEHCVSPVQPAIFKVQADVFVRCLIGPFIQNRSRSRLLAPDRSHFCNWLFIHYSFVSHWLGCHNSLTSRISDISGCKGQQGGKNWCRGFTECVYYFNTYAFCNIIWKGFFTGARIQITRWETDTIRSHRIFLSLKIFFRNL